ncbi:(d)CMP kinase [Cellulophaga sp. E16_2]|uniref:Cytidylate kinase n=1 Tax=Cellulophaga algicola (strain DSM 14237 / IC166 / ACAM 630) TaxID=688270 RepID=E6XDL9_CELAD|nr:MULTISPECIES: (d)CMP kinase [Cellulophaga]ADV50161.1 cytidylate kinase [Cellulophaga algicola DSM 14237]MBO0592546.1 (d)CMP kinase [Cellulophaga sp. E16_2]
MQKITIAIDGFSSTGKSTIAKQLAKSLGYIYVDTGAMYRAVTLFAMRNGFVGTENTNIGALVKLLPKINLKFVYNDALGFAEMYLNNENVEKEIRTLEVSRNVSQVATIEEVRYKLVDMQKKMGVEKGIVMDGRDIGTVVFPDAELKLFMTASAEKRATRRYKELLDKGDKVTFKEVLKNVEQRDYTDSHREFSPLKLADDAIEFDNSDMGLEEQFERILNYSQRVIDKQ